MNADPQIRNPELRAALTKLFSLKTFGVKLGLDPTLELLREFGNPHEDCRFIHVAGTNGKGSVCAMLASLYRELGLRVGLYSSPHLLNFRERIRVNGEMIPEERLALYAKEMMPAIDRIGCTFFEGTTAMGLRYFSEEKVDVVILETGMGGRLDSTNVVTPLVSVITSIGLDHTRHLGETYEDIAGEKAGIIKRGVPVIVGKVRPRLRRVFEEKASELSTSVSFVDDHCRSLHGQTDLKGTTATFMLDGAAIPELRIALPGKHQVENAKVALLTLNSLRDKYPIESEVIRDGMKNIHSNSGIVGRFHLVRSNPDVVIDVAHNPDGVKVLAKTLLEACPGRPVRYVFGAVQDKDVEEMIEVIKPTASFLHAVSANNSRSLPADEIAHWSEKAGIPTVVHSSVGEGVDQATENIASNEIIVIFGSFFVIAEGLQAINPQSPKTIRYMTMKTSPPPIQNDSHVEQHNDRKHRTVKEWKESERPRKRLMSRGASSLSNTELIAILLRSGTKERDVVEISKEIVESYDNLSEIAGRDYKELEKIKGIGPTKAVTLAAAFEFAKRVATEAYERDAVINGPEDVGKIYIPLFRGVKKEQFHVLVLNSANHVIRKALVSEGSLNASVVHPREVFRLAIIENAASVIGIHNHPSGNIEPSAQDIRITRQLIEAGNILGIPFHDHIIIGGEKYLSLVQEQLV